MLVGYPPFYDELPYGIYEKILAGQVHWPKSMDPLSRSIIKGFLTHDRTKRLGNMGGGAQDVLDHPWFRGVDWGALERKEINVSPIYLFIGEIGNLFTLSQAPIIPRTSSDDDTRHFLSLPFPPSEEIPGLLQDEPSLARSRFDKMTNQFLEF
jgi:protein kinase A